MKKINKLFFVALASVLLVAFYSCKEDETIVDPSTLLINGASINGSSDSIPTQGVYFPTQEASGDHTFDPTMDKVITVQLARTNAEGAITVPMVITASEEGIFKVGTASFADGQTETTFDIEFPNVETAVKYTLNLAITDPSYAAMFSSNPSHLDLSVFCVEWKWFGEKDHKFVPVSSEEEAAIFDVTFDWFEVETPAKAKYYEVGDYRTGILLAQDEVGFFGTKVMEVNFVWNTTNNDLYVAEQYMGWDYANQGEGDIPDAVPLENAEEPVFFYDWFSYWYKRGQVDGTAETFFGNAGYRGNYPPSYYDGNGGFIFNLKYYIPAEEGGWSGFTNDFRALAQGFIRVDYTLEVETDFSSEGVVPVYYKKLGKDVAEIKYVAVGGELTAREAGKIVDAIVDGTQEGVQSVKDFSDGGFGLTFEETGLYTVVLVAYDAEGNAQESTYKTFCYVKAGDEVPVIVNCGLAATGKYEPQGFLSDNSLEFYVYGSDLVDVKVGIYKYTDIVADADACKEDLMEAESLSAEELEQVNGNGFVDVFTKLNPGTEYYLLVWASNGYESKIISANATTTGDPLPIYMDYSYASIQEDMLPSASEGYFGMYNFYAVDHFGSLGMREYMSKVTIADSELADEDYENEGVAYHDEYVDVTGVFDYSTKYGVVDSLVFVYENGVLYYVQNTLNSTGYFGKTFMSSSTSYYNGGWALYGGFVADGYIAFVCPEAYASYGINGMNLVLYSDEELKNALGVSEWYEDMLLVDPAKDDNGVAPAGVQKRIVALHKEMSKPLSFFENPAARVRTAFEKVRHMPTNVANIAGIKGEREVKTVAVETVKIEKPVRVNRISNIEKVDVKAII